MDQFLLHTHHLLIPGKCPMSPGFVEGHGLFGVEKEEGWNEIGATPNVDILPGKKM